ncbi:MAG: 3-oxo-5-alpha-steroid 4-dehydrogenase [Bacteroidales bacterium]|nr:3-oxo-5-alpha-steroid 4-dehydrogenase [Bacteroidales bacterium]
MTMNTYNIILYAMAIMAVIVFICLFKFKAGYGYLRGGLGGSLSVPNKLGWVLMEAPAFVFLFAMLVWFFKSGGADEAAAGGSDPVVISIIAGLFLLHYFQRSFIFPFLMKGNSKMPVGIMFMGMVFNTINSYLIGFWLFKFAPAGMYPTSWLWNANFIFGTLIFLTGMIINMHSDHVIRSLRKPGDTKHYIPRKGLYKYVTSANYFGEFVEWCGFAMLSYSLAGLLFAVWTFANLAPRSKALTEKYIAEFGEEYASLGKKNMIPFVW